MIKLCVVYLVDNSYIYIVILIKSYDIIWYQCVSVFVRNLFHLALHSTRIRPSGHQAMVHTVRPGKYGARKGRGIGSPKPRDKASSRHWTLAQKYSEIAERWQRWQRCQRSESTAYHSIIHHRFQMLSNVKERNRRHATSCNL